MPKEKTKLDGPHYLFHDKALKKVHTRYFQNAQGETHGVLCVYYPHPKKPVGALKMKREFVNGQRHGRSLEWDEKGRIVKDLEYDHNRVIGGKLFKYDENGRQMFKKIGPPAIEQHRENGQTVVQQPSKATVAQNGHKPETLKI